MEDDSRQLFEVSSTSERAEAGGTSAEEQHMIQSSAPAFLALTPMSDDPTALLPGVPSTSTELLRPLAAQPHASAASASDLDHERLQHLGTADNWRRSPAIGPPPPPPPVALPFLQPTIPYAAMYATPTIPYANWYAAIPGVSYGAEPYMVCAYPDLTTTKLTTPGGSAGQHTGIAGVEMVARHTAAFQGAANATLPFPPPPPPAGSHTEVPHRNKWQSYEGGYDGIRSGVHSTPGSSSNNNCGGPSSRDTRQTPGRNVDDGRRTRGWRGNRGGHPTGRGGRPYAYAPRRGGSSCDGRADSDQLSPQNHRQFECDTTHPCESIGERRRGGTAMVDRATGGRRHDRIWTRGGGFGPSRSEFHEGRGRQPRRANGAGVGIRKAAVVADANHENEELDTMRFHNRGAAARPARAIPPTCTSAPAAVSSSTPASANSTVGASHKTSKEITITLPAEDFFTYEPFRPTLQAHPQRRKKQTSASSYYSKERFVQATYRLLVGDKAAADASAVLWNPDFIVAWDDVQCVDFMCMKDVEFQGPCVARPPSCRWYQTWHRTNQQGRTGEAQSDRSKMSSTFVQLFFSFFCHLRAFRLMIAYPSWIE